MEKSPLNIFQGFRSFMSIGLLIGGVAFVGIGAYLLFANERAYRDSVGLSKSLDKIVEISSDKVDPANDGKLVHLSGLVQSDEIIKDDEFGIEESVLKIERDVWYYQWVRYERKEDTGNRVQSNNRNERATVVNYNKEWTDGPVNSLRHDKKYKNPKVDEPYQRYVKTAGNLNLGSFSLSGDFLNNQVNYKLYELNPSNLGDIPNAILTNPVGGDIASKTIYIGPNTGSPTIGDVKINFKVIPHDTYSVLAMQQGNKLVPFRTDVGSDIEFVQYGELSPEEIYESVKHENSNVIMVFRILTIVLILLGFFMTSRFIKSIYRMNPDSAILKTLSSFLIVIAETSLVVGITMVIAWFG